MAFLATMITFRVFKWAIRCRVACLSAAMTALSRDPQFRRLCYLMSLWYIAERRSPCTSWRATQLFSYGMIWGKQFDGDLYATLHRCTLHFTAKVGRTSEMVLNGDTCATLHRCTIHVIIPQLVERGNYKWFRIEMCRQCCTNDNCHS